MRILLFGGTTEGRVLSENLAARGDDVTVCVATDYGREEQAQVEGVTILTGRKGPEEMRALMADHATGTEYVRVKRTLTTSETGTSPANIHYYGSAADVAEALTSTEGNVLLATGTKELGCFAGLSPERLVPRVLPSAENLAACEALGIPRRNIVAMQGPFSTDLNVALLRQKDIRYFVTKDGGPTGGFPEKAEASAQTGIPLLVIAPPDEEGLTVEEFLEARL